MKKRDKGIDRKNNKIHFELFFILFSLLLLAYIDFVVLELIHHPIASKFSIPWSAFETSLSFFGKQVSVFSWYLAFFPLAFLLFILLGIASKSWKISVSGIILFATGWEDIFYYIIQGKWLPSQLSWLDYSPIITLSRFITQTEHVTSLGLIISAIIGAVIAGIILFWNKIRKKN